MKLFLVAVVAAGLLWPAYGRSQHQPAAPVQPGVAKPESKQARYARLDQYARQLPEAQAVTVEKLAASLAAQARSDDDKARLIFAWLAYHVAYDVAYLKGDTTHSYTPEAVLQSRSAICQGYADLFTDLASRLKLEACTISGHAYDWLTTGNPLTAANGHAWNAYRVAGVWHLADATWGAGSTSWDSKSFKQEFDTYWFDLSPDQYIFTHLPTEPTWQLLPKLVTPVAFQNWPYIEPAWFQLISGTNLQRAFETIKKVPRRLPSVEMGNSKVACPVQIVQVPLQNKLTAGQPVRFVFQAPPEIRMTIDLYDKLVVLQTAGAYQQATVIPAAMSDVLRVYAWSKVDSSMVCSLEYDVVPAPRPQLRSGKLQPAPVDSVAYLRR